MKPELLECHPQEEKDVWGRMPNSSVQRVLHNEIVRQLWTVRDSFEGLTAPELPAYQEKIKALKFLLGLLHRNDQPPTK